MTVFAPSLGEIEAQCAKAVRGAGFEWGLAEEAGAAARALAAAGLPATALILALLDGPRGVAPVPRPGLWRGNGALCPLRTGAALSDFATLAAGPGHGPLRIEGLGIPALILPFLATAAARLGHPLQVAWPGAEALAGPDRQIALRGDRAFAEGPVDAILRQADGPSDLPPPPASRPPTPDDWDRLGAFALATTVPPSAVSRAGAGAGQDDD